MNNKTIYLVKRHNPIHNDYDSWIEDSYNALKRYFLENNINISFDKLSLLRKDNSAISLYDNNLQDNYDIVKYLIQ